MSKLLPLSLTLCLSLAGCGGGDGIERLLVSGGVSYADQPVEKGQIRFIPEQGTRGPVTIASIDGGRYDTSSSGGVPLGSHRVEIKGYDAHEYQTAPTGPGSPPVKQRLPNKYNRNSELTVTLDSKSSRAQDFELKP